MKRKAKAAAFRAEFPWLDKHLPPGDHEYNSAPVDADILDREPGFNQNSGRKNRILLLDKSGNLLTEVRGISGWWARVTIKTLGFSRMKQEHVSDALERGGDAADDVAFILFIGGEKRNQACVCVYHTRANTTVADVWRHTASQEEAKIRQSIQSEVSATEATATA